MIEERRTTPGDDLISRVLEAEYDDPESGSTSLSPNEVLMFCNLLSAAGSETTQKLLSNSLVALDEHHEQWDLLCAQPDLIPQAVDEALRYDSPTHWVARSTTRDVEVAGTTIPEGDWVLLLLGSSRTATNVSTKNLTTSSSSGLANRPCSSGGAATYPRSVVGVS